MTKPRAFSRLAAYLFVSVLLALGIAALVFAGVRSVLTNRMYDRVMSEAYQQQRSDESLASLQQFVDEHHLRISQVSRLQEWEKSHPYTITTVSTAYRLLYSTGMGTSDMLPLEEDGPVDLLIGSLPLRFLDGQAGVYFYHTDEARYEAMITAGTGIGAFALFVALLMIPINRKLRYIKRLCGDLKILEGATSITPSPCRGAMSCTTWPAGWRRCGCRLSASSASARPPSRPTPSWSPRSPTTCAPR